MSEFVRLGDHIDIAKGKPPARLPFDGPGASAYLTPEYLRGKASAVSAKPGADAVVVTDGDAVLLWDGSNAGEFFHGKAGLAASTMARLRADGSFDRGYFVHALKRLQPALQNQTSGTGIPHVDRGVLEGFKIFRPDAIEQAHISQVLDTLDTNIRQTEAIIEKLKQVKQGLLHDLLTRGIDANDELRPPHRQAPHLYKDSPLGWIPVAWQARRLADYMAAEITYGIVQAGPHVEGGVPYIRTGDMSGDRLDKASLLCTSRRIADSYRRSEVRADEIVMAIRATVGKVLPVPPELDGANLTQGTARLAPNDRNDPEFLLWAIRHHRAQTAILAEIKGTTFAEITLAALREVPLAAPTSIDEQRLIGERVAACEERIQQEHLQANKLKAQKTGLMDDLLTGRVRVTPLLHTASA
jgi:type I restriction enzyme, S subunit